MVFNVALRFDIKMDICDRLGEQSTDRMLQTMLGSEDDEEFARCVNRLMGKELLQIGSVSVLEGGNNEDDFDSI